jgi:acetyl esterase/lipase
VAETLDVYEPDPLPSSPVPAVVYIHGGGWVQGDSTLVAGSLVSQVAAAVEAKGFVFVSIDYRLAPRYRWPDQIEDATCAIRFLRAEASALHIDPAAIGAMGDSAGGQIVSLLGLAGRSTGFDTGAYLNQSSAVQAVVDLYGPADLTTPDWANAPLIQIYAPQAFGTTLGPGTPGTPTTDALVKASPVTYVGPHDPPFLIVQGDQDTVVPADQSRELADRLRAAGNAPTLVMVDHAEHGLLPVTGGPITPPISQLAAQTAAFLIHHLEPSKTVVRSAHRSARR